MKKFLIKLLGLPSICTNPGPIEMPVEPEDETFIDMATKICSAQSDEELLFFMKKTTSRDKDLRYLISLRSKELHEKI